MVLLSIFILQFVPAFNAWCVFELAWGSQCLFHIVHSVFLCLHICLPMKVCSNSTLATMFSPVVFVCNFFLIQFVLCRLQVNMFLKGTFVLNCSVFDVNMFSIHVLSISNLSVGYKCVFMFLSLSTNHDFPLCTWAFLSVVLSSLFSSVLVFHEYNPYILVVVSDSLAVTMIHYVPGLS